MAKELEAVRRAVTGLTNFQIAEGLDNAVQAAIGAVRGDSSVPVGSFTSSFLLALDAAEQRGAARGTWQEDLETVCRFAEANSKSENSNVGQAIKRLRAASPPQAASSTEEGA